MTTSHPASPRLFLALWPDADTSAALQAAAAAWSWPAAARRTRPERLHVTLHFLGAVDAARLRALRDGLAMRWKGCELELDAPQVWPGGMAVVEARQVPAGLAALHDELGARLRALDIAVEARRYRPHVTLARKAFGARPPVPFVPVRWRSGPFFELVQSLPGGRGYEPVERFG